MSDAPGPVWRWRWRGHRVVWGRVWPAAAVGSDREGLRDRLCRAWRPGGEVLVLPDGGWWERWADPVAGPGPWGDALPVVATAAGWSTVEEAGHPARREPPDADRLTWAWGGALRRVDARGLTPVPLDAGLDLAGLPHRPVQGPPPPPPPRPLPPRDAPVSCSAGAGAAEGAVDPASARGLRAAARARRRGTRPDRPPSDPWRDHLEDTLARLEAGDLDGALRRAPRLGRGRSHGAGAPPGPPADGVLHPELVPSTRPPARRTSLGTLPRSARDRLEAAYERAAVDLARRGRHEAAAFVWADLLGAPSRAVAVLEEGDLVERAAALSEGWGLDPVRTARLWWRAGSYGRALEGALDAGVVGALVAWVEARGATVSVRAALRVRWSEALAAAGRMAEAAAVLEPAVAAGQARSAAPSSRGAEACLRALGVPGARRGVAALQGRRRDLLEAAVKGGGVDGAAALAAWSETLPPATAARQVLEAAAPWLSPQDPSDGLATALHPAARAAMAQAVLDRPPSPALRALAAALCRARLAEASEAPAGWGRLVWSQARDLAEHAADPVLLADLPDPPAVAAAPSSSASALLAEGPAGQGPVQDAVLTAQGRLWVAQGEAGLSLRDGRGRALAWFPCRADRLIPDPLGQHLVVAGRQDGAWGLMRLPGPQGPLTSWTTLRADRLAPHHDGRGLVAIQGDQVLRLRRGRAGLELVTTLGTVPSGPGSRQVVAAPGGAQVVDALGAVWRVMQGAERATCTAPQGPGRAWLTPRGVVRVWGEAGAVRWSRPEAGVEGRWLGAPSEVVGVVEAGGDLLIGVSDGGGARIGVFAPDRGRGLGGVRVPGRGPWRLRAGPEDRWVLVDRGRAVVWVGVRDRLLARVAVRGGSAGPTGASRG